MVEYALKFTVTKGHGSRNTFALINKISVNMNKAYMIVHKIIWESGESMLVREKNQRNADPQLLSQKESIEVKDPIAFGLCVNKLPSDLSGGFTGL